MNFKQAIEYVRAGLLAKDPATRLAVCENLCEHYSKDIKVCNKCNCFMPAKTKLKSSKCPIDRW